MVQFQGPMECAECREPVVEDLRRKQLPPPTATREIRWHTHSHLVLRLLILTIVLRELRIQKPLYTHAYLVISSRTSASLL